MRVTECGVGIHQGQLLLPLVTFAPEVKEEVVCRPECPSMDGPEAFTWTDEEIAVMREGVLVNALTSLAKGHIGAKARRELVAWLDSEELEPFSFNVCAMVTDRDPEILRSAIHRVLEKTKENSTQLVA